MPDLDLKPVSSQLYDVYFTVPGGPRFVWRIATHGITVGEHGIAYAVNDRPRTAEFGDISAIHLSSASAGGGDVTDQCRIEFKNGDAITVSNVTANGLPKSAQTQVYRAFVHDLHSRIVTSGHDDIRFTAGMPSGRYKGALVVMVIAGLFFVATPLVLALITGDMQALILMGTGVFFVWPFMRLVSNNTPRNYTPDALPDELIS
jgi:hypothetical protein